MTKLIVKPIDTAARGSYKQRKRLLRAAKKLAAGTEAGDGLMKFEAYEEIEALAIDRLQTDDGTSVEEALDDLSADDFDALLEALLSSPVPTRSADSSEDSG